jgi:hypothetical protein
MESLGRMATFSGLEPPNLFAFLFESELHVVKPVTILKIKSHAPALCLNSTKLEGPNRP